MYQHLTIRTGIGKKKTEQVHSAKRPLNQTPNVTQANDSCNMGDLIVEHGLCHQSDPITGFHSRDLLAFSQDSCVCKSIYPPLNMFKAVQGYASEPGT